LKKQQHQHKLRADVVNIKEWGVDIQ